jgi:hypothetical protein
VEIPWIRVHYAYPTGLTPEVLSAFRDVPNVLPYLDLPLQHSHPEVLRAMNRPWQADLNRNLLDRIRDHLPDAVLRTTLIVGYPGETEQHFQHLLDFVEEQRFDHVGVFTFSPEEGTAAASQPNPVPAAIAAERRDRADGPAAADRRPAQCRLGGKDRGCADRAGEPRPLERCWVAVRVSPPRWMGKCGCAPAPAAFAPLREPWSPCVALRPHL